MKKQVSKRDLIDLLEEEGSHEISNTPSKHDCSWVTAIVMDDNIPHLVTFERSYDYGIEDGPFTLYPAESYEVMVTKWRKKA